MLVITDSVTFGSEAYKLTVAEHALLVLTTHAGYRPQETLGLAYRPAHVWHTLTWPGSLQPDQRYPLWSHAVTILHVVPLLSSPVLITAWQLLYLSSVSLEQTRPILTRHGIGTAASTEMVSFCQLVQFSMRHKGVKSKRSKKSSTQVT